MQALLEHWPRPYTLEDESDHDNSGHNRGGAGGGAGNEYFSVPGHTPVIFSEVGGRTLYRLLARDAGGETEGVLLNETVPAWVVDIVVEKKLPKFIKVFVKNLSSIWPNFSLNRSRFSFCLIPR